MQNKIKSVIAIFILTLSIPMLQTHKTLETDPTYLKVVNPLTGDGWFNFTTDTTMAGDTFVVNITVTDVTDLYNWGIKLAWDASLLDFVSISRPIDHVFAASGKDMISAPVESGPGYVIWGCTYINGDPGTPEYWTFNGTGTLCQVTLKITQAVGHRIPEVNCALAFTDVMSNTYLISGGNYDIPFTPVDGFYDYKYIPQPTVISIIDAVTGSNTITLGTPGQPVPPEGHPFTINVTLDGVTQDLNTFQIAISFDKTRIACTGYSFPTDSPNYVFYNINVGGGGMICNDEGYVVLGGTILPTIPPQNPPTIYSGILCQIDFIATATGTSALNIIPTQFTYQGVPMFDSFLWEGPYEFPFTTRSLSVSCGIGTIQPPPINIGGKDYVISIESNTTITNVVATRNTLHFSTSGPSGETGYINATIPVGLNKTAITVYIDKVKLTPPPYPIITTNGTHYFVYFEFTLSTHDIDITYAVADIAATELTRTKTLVGRGYLTHINATLQNQGEYEETINVTVYANTTEIETQEITLSSGNSATVTFTWNTTDFAKGNYTISAYAWPILGETDIDDNTLVGDAVSVGTPCDVTGQVQGVPDGVCNMRDIGYFCSKFMTNEANCDVTGPTPRFPDGIVNMRDIGEACSNFMKEDP